LHARQYAFSFSNSPAAGNAGGAFFNGTDAATISVNPALLLTPALIAASANGQPGNSGNALTMADMQQAAQAGLGGATINTAYSQLVTQLGSDVRDATQTTDNATILAGSLDDKRQSVSGVSLDEEMSNLVKFQRGYQASSRALSAMDEMIDQLINRTGKVGL